MVASYTNNIIDGETITLEDLEKIAKKIKLVFSKEELAECKMFLERLSFFWKYLSSCKYSPVNDVTQYVNTIWGEEPPYITFSELKSISAKFYDPILSKEVITHNATFVSEDGYIMLPKNQTN